MLQSTGVVAQAECTASSQHSSAASLIGRGLYDDLHSFAELEQRITNLGAENTKIVGDAFEIFVEAYLATHQKLQVDTVWLVGQVPLEIRNQLNLPKDAKGIDGVFRTRTGLLVPYQVKFRSQRAYLTYTEIAPFLGLTERAADRIVFTNSNELAQDVKNRDAMRTVRGIDFDDLSKEDFRAISGWLRKQPVAIPKPSPYPYQSTALEKIAETFAKYDRAHGVMACGTGKTLVALWAVEHLKPKTVLVLVPSLTLLQQTLDEWSRHNTWRKDFSYICVCSDPTVASKDENDPITFHRTDAEFRVDTDPAVVHSFIRKGSTSIKVIFSTYQSAPIVSEGLRGLPPLDVAVFDEAHKTAGPQGGFFGHCLSEENIRIRKRLFLTATPRHFDIRHRNREGDFRIVSMDNQTVYGPRAYTLTFGSAAHQGIICNYKVVISVVDGQEVNDFALKHGITLVKGDLIGARWVANQIAVERAIEKTGAVRAITFHSRVSSAKEFGADTSRGIQQWLPNFSVFHVNGTQRSSERKQLIRSFRQAKTALITNARCLTEGIDVPVVDMVAFVDPRHSRVDIAQATGRAMRKPKGSDKTIGYVVIPLFLERRKGEKLEEALRRSEFDDIADVLNAMQEQDEELVQIIREIREAEGRGQVFDPRRLMERVEVLGASIELSTLRSNIFAEVVDRIGINWDEWYGRLSGYVQREGHCRVRRDYLDNGFRLGSWVVKQRTNKEVMPVARRQRLDRLGFVWEPWEEDWNEGFNCLTSYKTREGHCRVPLGHKENGYELGRWVNKQRTRKHSMPIERKARLDGLGFVWDPSSDQWERGIAYLTRYKDREGHCQVPALYLENSFRLGNWVRNQRVNQGEISSERRHRLDALGFEWDILSDQWQKNLHHLRAYKKREGHCLVPAGHKENGFDLGRWVNKQRMRKEKISTVRIKNLEEIGFVWDARSDNWEQDLSTLKGYKEREGHCRVPKDHIENGFRLGQWIGIQRAAKNRMPYEHRLRLDKLGFVWDARSDQWEEGLTYFKAYKRREGHCRVPNLHLENGFGLGGWVSRHRARKDKLSSERQRQLDQLGFVWEPWEEDWNEGYAHLKAYKNRENHCLVPTNHEEGRYPLGAWVIKQRAKQIDILPDRRRKLNALGFVWDRGFEAGWEKGFNSLTQYKNREGHCRVPKAHIEQGYRLGMWVNGQRQKKGTMPIQRRKRLDSIGFIWDRVADQWEEGLKYLRIYNAREGHSRVPLGHIENGFPLGDWVRNRRRSHHEAPAKHQHKLNELKFVWDPFEAEWIKGFNHLTEYKAHEGHCLVPYSHKEDGYPLGIWIRTQRKRKNKMPVERRKQLDELGFEWKER